MTEEQASREPGPPPETAPRQDDGRETHANAQPPVPASLGEWRGPVFWMSCGALLAGMAVGALVLAQRVSVERDMMAVAATLPPVGATSGAAPASAPAATPPRPPEAAVIAPSAQPAAPERAVRVRPATPALHAAARTTLPHKNRARKPKFRNHVTSAPVHERYAEVFRRCPELGLPGSVECRRHICNGAEREGPACRPYRTKQR